MINSYSILFSFFSLFFCSCVSQSKVSGKTTTKILWLERYQGHYTSGEDTMVKGSIGGFVYYDKKTDSISTFNYESGYYETDYDNSKYLKSDSLITDKDWYNNKLVLNTFFKNQANKENSTRIEFNNFWKYQLCKVTIKEFYIGKIEQFVPKFETSKESPYLEYEKINVPTYLIKIISIEPYIEEK